MSNPRVDISNYLSNKAEGKNAHGLCRVWKAKVYWTTQKPLSHKRGGICTGQSQEEMNFFRDIGKQKEVIV
jgi:hypothetical protein